MGCAWFQPSREQDEISTCLQKIDTTLQVLRLKHNHYYDQIRVKGKSRAEQKLLLVYMKRNHGLQITLLNVKYSVEQGAITRDVVSVLRYARNTLSRLTTKTNAAEVYQLVDDMQAMSDDLAESSDALANLQDDLIDEELEQELQQLEIQSNSNEPLPVFPTLPPPMITTTTTHTVTQPLLPA